MSRHRLFTTAVLFLAVWPALAFAEVRDAGSPHTVVTEGRVKLHVSVDKDVAKVAEPIQLVLEIEVPRGTRVELPNLPDQLGDFDVRRSERLKDMPSGDAADVRRWVLKATLETIKTGECVIPPLDVRYANDAKSATFKTLRSKPLHVRITSVLENRTDLRTFSDIKDAVDVAVPEMPSRAWIAWTAAGAGGLLACAALTVVLAKRRRRRPSPTEWALAAISDLEKLPVANAADAEAVYNEVVDIIREFFGLEFAVPTLSRTTREFLAEAAQQVGLGELPRKRLSWLARLADEIKFARLGIGEQQVRQAIEQARAFVSECEQRPQTATEEAA